MARNYARSGPMTESIRIRATQKDKTELTIAAQNMGMDVSGFVRYILIKEKVINPV